MKEAYKKSGKQWPIRSSEDLNKVAHTNFFTSYEYMIGNVSEAGRIILSLQTKDPIILEPLRGIRGVLLSAIFFPLFIGILLIVVAVFFVV